MHIFKVVILTTTASHHIIITCSIIVIMSGILLSVYSTTCTHRLSVLHRLHYLILALAVGVCIYDKE